MAAGSQNPLVSSTRASDTSPTVQLHPLVLLTITDIITRHTLRQQEGPVVGAIIGQQNGHEVTMEVAFQAKLVSNEQGDVVLDDEWFMKRLDDCEFQYAMYPRLDACFQKCVCNADHIEQTRKCTSNRSSILLPGLPSPRPPVQRRTYFPFILACQSLPTHRYYVFSILPMQIQKPPPPASYLSRCMSPSTRMRLDLPTTRQWISMVLFRTRH